MSPKKKGIGTRDLVVGGRYLHNNGLFIRQIYKIDGDDVYWLDDVGPGRCKRSVFLRACPSFAEDNSALKLSAGPEKTDVKIDALRSTTQKTATGDSKLSQKNKTAERCKTPKDLDAEDRLGLEEYFDSLFPGGFTLRDEANAIVAYAFREGLIEDLHAGKNSELLRNDKLSRITNQEMKELMISASKKIEKLLKTKDSNIKEYYDIIKGLCLRYCSGWER